jgi:hypothetical protein
MVGSLAFIATQQCVRPRDSMPSRIGATDGRSTRNALMLLAVSYLSLYHLFLKFVSFTIGRLRCNTKQTTHLTVSTPARSAVRILCNVTVLYQPH